MATAANDDALKAHLIVIYEHARDALKLMDTPQVEGLSLPSGVCRHTNRAASMGGYWTCLDCGAKGRDL